MQYQTQLAALLERGTGLLRDGRLTEAADTFAEAAQLDPQSTGAQLGLAQTYFARGELDRAQQAARQTEQLGPDSADGLLGHALALAMAGQFAPALQADEQSIVLDPGRPYAHALRGYCLRQLGQRYEGELAYARAARGWGTRDFAHLFPAPAPTVPAASPQPDIASGLAQRIAYTPQRPWAARPRASRTMTRFRFATRGVPIATFSLIAVNVIIYLACAALAGNLFQPFQGAYIIRSSGLFVGAPGPLYNMGVEQGLLMAHDPLQVYRVFTSMFLHESITHIGVNMLSLYFVGVITEQLFGVRRFLVIYFVGGIIGGIAQAVLLPAGIALGASGAIFAIFGAFGAFGLLRRRQLGSVANLWIGQWLFWLVINIVVDINSPTTIGIYDHLGGLVAGFALGALMLSLAARQRLNQR